MDSRVDQIFSRRINEKADRKCILAGRYGCKIDKIQLGVRKKNWRRNKRSTVVTERGLSLGVAWRVVRV